MLGRNNRKEIDPFLKVEEDKVELEKQRMKDKIKFKGRRKDC